MTGREYQRFELEIQGHKYVVYDLLTSVTARLLHDDLVARSQFNDIKEPRVILDVGANIGMVSFLAAKTFPNAKVYAVEPHATNIKHFLLGQEENQLPNVTLLPIAVGETQGLVDLTLEMGNTGSANSYPHNFRMFPKDWPMITRQNLAITLDQLLEVVGEVDHLKMDIEGAEFGVLASFTAWDSVKSLHIELHPFCLPITQAEAKKLVEEFSSYLRDRMGDKPLTIVGPDFEAEPTCQ